MSDWIYRSQYREQFEREEQESREFWQKFDQQKEAHRVEIDKLRVERSRPTAAEMILTDKAQKDAQRMYMSSKMAIGGVIIRDPNRTATLEPNVMIGGESYSYDEIDRITDEVKKDLGIHKSPSVAIPTWGIPWKISTSKWSAGW